MGGLIERLGGIESIIRGGAYTRTQAMDVSFAPEVSASSPLFNLPVVAIQRGRDHGKQPGTPKQCPVTSGKTTQNGLSAT